MSEFEELNRRSFDGITVVLKWVRGTIDTVIEVKDIRTDDQFAIRVPGDVPSGVDPHTVYYHPFAYRPIDK